MSTPTGSPHNSTSSPPLNLDQKQITDSDETNSRPNILPKRLGIAHQALNIHINTEPSASSSASSSSNFVLPTPRTHVSDEQENDFKSQLESLLEIADGIIFDNSNAGSAAKESAPPSTQTPEINCSAQSSLPPADTIDTKELKDQNTNLAPPREKNLTAASSSSTSSVIIPAALPTTSSSSSTLSVTTAISPSKTKQEETPACFIGFIPEPSKINLSKYAGTEIKLNQTKLIVALRNVSYLTEQSRALDADINSNQSLQFSFLQHIANDNDLKLTGGPHVWLSTLQPVKIGNSADDKTKQTVSEEVRLNIAQRAQKNSRECLINLGFQIDDAKKIVLAYAMIRSVGEQPISSWETISSPTLGEFLILEWLWRNVETFSYSNTTLNRSANLDKKQLEEIKASEQALEKSKQFPLLNDLIFVHYQLPQSYFETTLPRACLQDAINPLQQLLTSDEKELIPSLQLCCEKVLINMTQLLKPYFPKNENETPLSRLIHLLIPKIDIQSDKILFALFSTLSYYPGSGLSFKYPTLEERFLYFFGITIFTAIEGSLDTSEIKAMLEQPQPVVTEELAKTIWDTPGKKTGLKRSDLIKPELIKIFRRITGSEYTVQEQLQLLPCLQKVLCRPDTDYEVTKNFLLEILNQATANPIVVLALGCTILTPNKAAELLEYAEMRSVYPLTEFNEEYLKFLYDACAIALPAENERLETWFLTINRMLLEQHSTNKSYLEEVHLPLFIYALSTGLMDTKQTNALCLALTIQLPTKKSFLSSLVKNAISKPQWDDAKLEPLITQTTKNFAGINNYLLPNYILQMLINGNNEQKSLESANIQAAQQLRFAALSRYMTDLPPTEKAQLRKKMDEVINAATTSPTKLEDDERYQTITPKQLKLGVSAVTLMYTCIKENRSPHHVIFFLATIQKLPEIVSGLERLQISNIVEGNESDDAAEEETLSVPQPQEVNTSDILTQKRTLLDQLFFTASILQTTLQSIMVLASKDYQEIAKEYDGLLNKINSWLKSFKGERNSRGLTVNTLSSPQLRPRRYSFSGDDALLSPLPPADPLASLQLQRSRTQTILPQSSSSSSSTATSTSSVSVSGSTAKQPATPPQERRNSVTLSLFSPTFILNASTSQNKRSRHNHHQRSLSEDIPSNISSLLFHPGNDSDSNVPPPPQPVTITTNE